MRSLGGVPEIAQGIDRRPAADIDAEIGDGRRLESGAGACRARRTIRSRRGSDGNAAIVCGAESDDSTDGPAGKLHRRQWRGLRGGILRAADAADRACDVFEIALQDGDAGEQPIAIGRQRADGFDQPLGLAFEFLRARRELSGRGARCRRAGATRREPFSDWIAMTANSRAPIAAAPQAPSRTRPRMSICSSAGCRNIGRSFSVSFLNMRDVRLGRPGSTANQPANGSRIGPGSLCLAADGPSAFSTTIRSSMTAPVPRRSDAKGMTTARTCLTIVLAAGEGTRMRSSLPKVLHQVARADAAGACARRGAAGRGAGRPLSLSVPITTPSRRRPSASFRMRRSPCRRERRGTAHAVLAAKDAIARGFDDLLVIFADTPLITPGHACPSCAARWRTARQSRCSDFARPIRPVTGGS